MSVLIALVLLASPDPTSQARERFKSAQLHYSLGEFEDAVKDFREAYRLRQEPAILFNIAQCYRQLRMWREAYFNYRQYLNLKKDVQNRDEVESLLGEMRKRMDEEDAQKTRIAPNPALAKNAETTLSIPATPPQPPQEAPLFATSAPVPQEGGGVRPAHVAGYVALGLGVAAEGAAFLFHSSAQTAADQFNQKYQSGQLTAADAQLKNDAQSKGTLATAALIGGAALIVTGAVLSFAF